MATTTMHDAKLRAALEGGGAAADPVFRIRVIQRICERARRRALAERMVLWAAVGLGAGLVARTLTPAGAGVPGLESVAMTVSLIGAAFVLAEVASGGSNRLFRGSASAL